MKVFIEPYITSVKKVEKQLSLILCVPLMEEKTGDMCKTYHYLTSTSWRLVLFVVLLMETDKKSTS